MLRRALIMAAAQNQSGKRLLMDNIPMSKGGMGRNDKTKPPTGRQYLGSSQSETALANGMKNLSMRNSSRASETTILRRPYSANRRPVVIKNVEDIATLLKEQFVKNVVVVAGAGISTPSGIPDFRSPGTGLYDNLQQYSIPYAEAIFDIDYFHHNPRPFFTLAKELYPSGKYRPNYLHYFAKLLHDRGLLLRMYTQNIDGLERIAGIPPDKMVEAHGTFATATCTRCRTKYDGEDIKEKIFQDKIPHCERVSCRGIVKPDIVFFGEELPKRFYYYLKDMLQTDLVIIMGTSLEVQPFAGIIDTVRFTVPRLLFNRMPVGPFKRNKRSQDFVAEGDLLEQMQQFVGILGWSEEMTSLITRKEGLFKLAFPPPAPPASEKKATATPLKRDPVANMWRQTAQLNFYSDSDSSESDSAATVSDTDTSTDSEADHRPKRGAAVQKRGKNGGGQGDMDSGKGSSVISSSSNASNTSGSTEGAGDGKGIAESKQATSANGTNSDKQVAATAAGAQTDRGLLHRRKNGNGLGPVRLFSQQALAAPVRKNREPLARRTAWVNKDNQKPPLAPAPPSRRKPDHQGRHAGGRQPYSSRLPPPGSHAAKPRSNSVTKAVPEKAHTAASDNLKALYPRLKSADTAKLAYRHRLQTSHPYDARMLSIQAGVSDSSSSEDLRDDDDDDDIDDSSDS